MCSRIPDDGTAGRPPAVVMKLDVEGRSVNFNRKDVSFKTEG